MQISVLYYLEHSVAVAPDKIAFADDDNALTFSALQSSAQAIGTCLLDELGPGKNKPIFVLTDRRAACIAGFMGVLMSGNCYVPIDNQTPPGRLWAMRESINPAAVIYWQGEEACIEALEDLPAFRYDEAVNTPVNTQKLSDIRRQMIDIDLCYILFTSGSTGMPKGVAINHRSVIDLTEWLSTEFNLSIQDTIGNQTPFYFDASVKDIYSTLRNAATTYILSKKLFVVPIKLIETLNNRKINTILWATSAIRLLANFNVFEKAVPTALTKVFFAGENLSAKQLNKWREALPQAVFVNLYGPTEITVDCAYYIVNRSFEDGESIPIGTACRNMELLLLDEQNKLVADGMPGEIVVRGTGVAAGYYNDPQKTSISFIQNPFHNHYEDILYRTGDYARKNEWGELVFVSRADGQVKHMGNRIELGEIEAAAYALLDVQAAVCFYDHDKENIVLMIQSKSQTPSMVLGSLAKRLPRYMTPSRIILVDEMPENANGKIDRVALQKGYKNGTYY